LTRRVFCVPLTAAHFKVGQEVATRHLGNKSDCAVLAGKILQRLEDLLERAAFAVRIKNARTASMNRWRRRS
jgi:hypothetical protein